MTKHRALDEASWKELIGALKALAQRNELCPGQNRINGGKPFAKPKVGMIREAGSHLGAAGRGAPRGAGLLVMSGCNLRCRGCLYYETSIEEKGTEMSVQDLAQVFLKLQGEGMKRVVVMNGAHQAHHVVEALHIANRNGFTRPVIWYTTGYEFMPVVDLLHKVVDVWVMDLKFSTKRRAEAYLGVPDYPEIAKKIVRHLDEITGPVELDGERAAVTGMVLRFLYLPDHLAEARSLFAWIKKELGADTYVEIIPCYIPVHETEDDPKLGKRVTVDDIEELLGVAREVGLERVEVT